MDRILRMRIYILPSYAYGQDRRHDGFPLAALRLLQVAEWTAFPAAPRTVTEGASPSREGAGACLLG
jgi:hypothetical protein